MAIVTLEIFGARVSSVTCDGAQTIKTTWVDCGISANSNDKGQITCSMEHPTAKEQNKRILFMQGVPYLYKCLTNFIYSRRKLVKAKRKSTKKQKGSNFVVKKFPLSQDQQSVPYFTDDKIQICLYHYYIS